MGLWQKIKRFFKPVDPSEIRSYRVYIEANGEPRKLLGEYLNVTLQEFDERVQQDQAQYSWKMFQDDAAAGRQPQMFFANLFCEEIANEQ